MCCVNHSCSFWPFEIIHTANHTSLDPGPCYSREDRNSMSVTPFTTLDNQLTSTWGPPTLYPDGEPNFSMPPCYDGSFSGYKISLVICLIAHTEGLRKVPCIHRSNGDVWVFQPPVVWVWIPASLLDKVPGVGMAAAGSGHAPDRHLQLSLPKLWRGWPSALQPESPGLCPCCRQRGVHTLPESHWAQVGRWVFISEWGPELRKYESLFSPKKSIN